MKYQAVIFDLDGVICHTDQYHFLAWKQIATELNLHFDQKLNNQLRGVGRMQSFKIILNANHTKLSPDDMLTYAEKKNDAYRALLEQMSTADLDSDVRRTLDFLHANGMKMAIGSSSKNTKFILKRIGLDTFFDAISDGTNITCPKPDPEVFLLASKYLGIPPKACIVVEDAQAGIQAAAAGGMDSAAIGDAVNSPLSTYQLTRLSDLLSYVL